MQATLKTVLPYFLKRRKAARSGSIRWLERSIVYPASVVFRRLDVRIHALIKVQLELWQFTNETANCPVSRFKEVTDKCIQWWYG